MSMGEVERATARLEAAIGRLEHRLSRLGNSKPDDAEIISGLQHGTISPVALRYLARRLRPYIRAQILSLAMLLRFSLGEADAADAIDTAVAKTIADGFRTGDIATGRDGETKVGTSGMGDAVLARI